MARRTLAERLAQIDAQKKALQARLGQQQRACDTRRKVLLGALVLQRLQAGHDPDFTQRLADWLRRELPGFLTRDADRALFADLIGPGTAAVAPTAQVDARGTGTQSEAESAA